MKEVPFIWKTMTNGEVGAYICTVPGEHRVYLSREGGLPVYRAEIYGHQILSSFFSADVYQTYQSFHKAVAVVERGVRQETPGYENSLDNTPRQREIIHDFIKNQNK